MKAFEIVNETLKMTDRPVPAPQDGGVLIKVHAAGINRPDIFQRMGAYPPPEGVTDIPGLEVAGEIMEPAGNFKKGDKVLALLAGGGYAEYAAVPIQQVLPIPNGLSMVEAAAIPETFFTVWTNLFDSGKLQKGETLLVHGGSSGIGSAAIQIAKYFDCRVLTTAGTDEKCQFCKDLGADIAVNYKKNDFEDVLKDEKIDVILDMVGGDYYAKNVRLLSPFGRLVSIASLNGKVGEVEIFRVMRKRLTLTGSTLRARSADEKGEIAKAMRENIWPAIEAGQIRPIIDKSFPFDQAEEAQQYMIGGGHMGKIVLSLA